MKTLGIAISALVLTLAWSSPAFAGVGGGPAGTCVSACGGFGAGDNGDSCYCDSACTSNGDCCSDYQPVCNGNTGCTPNAGKRYILHLGGMCSTGWDSAMASKTGYTSIDVKAVQTNNSGLSDGSHTMGIYLDQCCTGSNACYVINYSGGDNVMGHRFANSSTAWNIYWVGTSAGAGGGSEISGGWLSDIFGGCDYATHLGTSESRNSYNHNDTNGETVYRVGGNGYMFAWYNPGNIVHTMLPGSDDGAVAYHSAGGMTSTGSHSSLCGGQYTNSVIAWTCSGYQDDEHYEMKQRFINNMGW